jgi:hypothetical protein
VEYVLRQAEKLVANEKKRIAEIASGVVFKPEINDTLRKKGVIQ